MVLQAVGDLEIRVVEQRIPILGVRKPAHGKGELRVLVGAFEAWGLGLLRLLVFRWLGIWLLALAVVGLGLGLGVWTSVRVLGLDLAFGSGFGVKFFFLFCKRLWVLAV